MQFIETRGNDGQKPSSVPFSEAILSPSASFGGLYVPQELPALGTEFLEGHLSSHYKTLALDFLQQVRYRYRNRGACRSVKKI